MSSAPSSRLAWIDVLRGLAVLGMIETHCVNAFLDSSFDGAPWLHQLSYFNGLVAPTFIWIAGYIQGRTVRRSMAQGRTVLSRKRLGRIGQIALIGYLLHLPWPLWIAGDFSAESWRILLQTDVLQCLAASLLVLLLLGQYFRRGFDAALLVITLAVVALAPWMWQWHSGNMLVESWVNRGSGSLFPLFPWFAFAGAGALSSRWEPKLWTFGAFGLAFAIAGTALAPYPFHSEHPSFVLMRLGYLMVGVGVVHALAQRLSFGWLLLAGRESLLLYVSHLVIIYSLPITGKPLNQIIGHELSVPAVALVFVGLMSVCLLLAWVNEWRKSQSLTEASTA